MDLAVTLPLAVLLFLQSLLSLLLLGPRVISKQAAALLSFTRTSPAVSAVLYTVAGVVLVITLSGLLQLWEVKNSLSTAQFGDRALALSAEQMRALLAVVLGLSNLVLLFLNRALAHEQQTADKAQLNLEVLQKQAKGLQSEYMRATNAEGSSSSRNDSSKSEISKLISDKERLSLALKAAETKAEAARLDADTIKSQAKGLEREYDRLLAEYDSLKRRLARGDTQYSSADKKSA